MLFLQYKRYFDRKHVSPRFHDASYVLTVLSYLLCKEIKTLWFISQKSMCICVYFCTNVCINTLLLFVVQLLNRIWLFATHSSFVNIYLLMYMINWICKYVYVCIHVCMSMHRYVYIVFLLEITQTYFSSKNYRQA